MVPYLADIALTLALAYTFFSLYIINQPKKKVEKKQSGSAPSISILVPFRDEERTLEKSILSLEKLDYPTEQLEILLLDDRSKDNSVDIALKAIKGKDQFKLIAINSDLYGLYGKMNVLAQAMDYAKGDIILFTDADCIVNPQWANGLLNQFSENTGMVCGLTVPSVNLAEKNGLLSKMQFLDWIYLQTIAEGCSNINRPLTVVGNNLAIRRQAYNACGGYRNIPFSVTEDFALMQAILENTDYTVKTVLEEDTQVFTAPVAHFSTFIKQRLRWIKGGLKANYFAYIVVAMLILNHLAILLLFLMGDWQIRSSLAIGLVIGIDFLMIKHTLRKIGRSTTIVGVILFEIFYILYTLMLLATIPFNHKIMWKGRIYK